jgi:hypothetical protein
VDPAADAVEQVDAERAFQVLHLLGHRRLADVQALGPPGHAAGLGHCMKDRQMFQIDVYNS